MFSFFFSFSGSIDQIVFKITLWWAKFYFFFSCFYRFLCDMLFGLFEFTEWTETKVLVFFSLKTLRWQWRVGEGKRREGRMIRIMKADIWLLSIQICDCCRKLIYKLTVLLGKLDEEKKNFFVDIYLLRKNCYSIHIEFSLWFFFFFRQL